MTLSWKPKRRGPVYCSTACGHGCTMTAHKEAVESASKLAKKLRWSADEDQEEGVKCGC